MLMSLACLLFVVFACTPTRVASRKVYYELGLPNSDHITIVAAAGPASSMRFGPFFQAFSSEFEQCWPSHCPYSRCLTNSWQITLEDRGTKMLTVHMQEIPGTQQTAIVRKFSVDDFTSIKVFTQWIVRAVIATIANLTRQPAADTEQTIQ